MRLLWALFIFSAEFNINNFSNGHYTEGSFHLFPEKELPVATGKEAACFPFLVWTCWRMYCLCWQSNTTP